MQIFKELRPLLRHLASSTLITMVFCTAINLIAAPWEGVLPQGEIPEVESIIPVKKDSYVPKSCFDDFATSTYEKVYIDASSQKIYILDQGPIVGQLMDKVLPYDIKKGNQSSKEVVPPAFQYRRSVLYELEYKHWKPKRLAYMELPDAQQIFVVGLPTNTIYALSFISGEACGRGSGALFGLNFKLPLHQRDVRYRLGDYSATRFERGGLVFDSQLAHFFELASGRFQLRRILFPIPKDEIPLYASSSNTLIESWQTGEGTVSAPRGVKIYRKNSVIEAKVRFRPGDKLIRDGDRSAVVSIDAKNNQITLLEIKRLTKVREPISFSFRLPEPFKVEHANLAVNFRNKVAIISGNTDIVRKQWKKVLLIDYRTSVILAQFEARDGFDIHTAFLEPKGQMAFIVERDKSRNLASRLHAFDMKTKRWRMLDLASIAE